MILITGASGFLGRELVQQLARRGVSVRGTDIAPPSAWRVPPREFLRGDLLDPEFCRRACHGVWAIIHTAARQHHSRPPRWGRGRFFRANVDMTRNLVDAGGANFVRQFVFVSSDMVYGLPHGEPLKESDDPKPIGPYGRSKLECERVCQTAILRGMTVTILRPRLIVGPGRLGILQRLFARLRENKPVFLFGLGRNRYQMVSVGDVADACVRAIELRQAGLFNLGSEHPPTVRALLERLRDRVASRSWILPLPSGPAKAALWALHGLRLSPMVPEQFRIADVDYVLDTTLARGLLGWRPVHSDVEALAAAYQWYLGDIVSWAERPVEQVKILPATLERNPGLALPFSASQGQAEVQERGVR